MSIEDRRRKAVRLIVHGGVKNLNRRTHIVLDHLPLEERAIAKLFLLPVSLGPLNYIEDQAGEMQPYTQPQVLLIWQHIKDILYLRADDGYATEAAARTKLIRMAFGIDKCWCEVA